jgi:hypothetical protein
MMKKSAKQSPHLTVEDIKLLLDYDAITGRLLWKERPAWCFASTGSAKAWNTKYCGKEAFTAIKHGYFSARILGRGYLKHRVIWAFTRGDWPINFIDHINGDTRDNRPENLRDVTRQENARNAAIPINNKSGIVGVRWNKETQKWVAFIKVDFRNIHLGSFGEKDDAAKARKAAEQRYGFLSGHGRASIETRQL